MSNVQKKPILARAKKKRQILPKRVRKQPKNMSLQENVTQNDKSVEQELPKTEQTNHMPKSTHLQTKSSDKAAGKPAFAAPQSKARSQQASKKSGSEDILINVESVNKSFEVGDQTVEVLKGIDLEIEVGDFVIIFGSSGSGKSTLLHIILGLEGPTTGKLKFMGNDMYTGTDEDYLAEVRKKHIGMVYQQANWIKSLSVAENIAFPLQLLGMEKELAVERARQTLAKFELEDWADYFPTELSSGQQQRISMARAIIHNPMLIVADEPTGNLDYENGVKVMELLTKLNKEEKKTVIMVTHDLEYLSYARTAVQIFDGQVVGVFRGKDKYKIETTVKQRKQYDPDAERTAQKKSEKADAKEKLQSEQEGSLAGQKSEGTRNDAMNTSTMKNDKA